MHERPSTSASIGTSSMTGSVRSLVDETLSAWEPMFSALDDTWQAWTRGMGGTTSQPAGHPAATTRGTATATRRAVVSAATTATTVMSAEDAVSATAVPPMPMSW